MDIPLDHYGARQVGVSAEAGPNSGRAPLDWHGLMARLAAAHAARLILAAQPTAGETISGSFAPDVARAMAVWRDAVSGLSEEPSSPDVNLNAKADGKPRRTIERRLAGADRPIV